jgi:hypothetical protein
LFLPFSVSYYQVKVILRVLLFKEKEVLKHSSKLLGMSRELARVTKIKIPTGPALTMSRELARVAKVKIPIEPALTMSREL